MSIILAGSLYACVGFYLKCTISQPVPTLLSNDIYHFFSITELCNQARRLPDSNSSKARWLSDTDALALKNEELKRNLEGKKDTLESAIKAQVRSIQ